MGSCYEDDGYCCSQKGYCGKTSGYCSIAKGCQIDYGKCESIMRTCDDVKNALIINENIGESFSCGENSDGFVVYL